MDEVKDIVPQLLEAIVQSYQDNVKRNILLQKMIATIKDGKGDYDLMLKAAKEHGISLSGAFKKNIIEGTLPEGVMYYNIARRLLDNLVRANYENVAPLCVDVQNALNEKNGISLKAVKPSYKADKTKGLIDYISNSSLYSDVEKSFLDALETNSKSIVDDSVRENCEFQAECGMSPVIERYAIGKTCEWCANLAGVYRYPDDVPEEVYHRHANCDCVVIYKPDKHAKDYQDIWSKQWNDKEAMERISAHNNMIDANGSKGDNRDRQAVIDGTQKLRQALPPDDYEEFINHIADNPNSDIAKVYSKYADGLHSFTLTRPEGDCYYSPANYIKASFAAANEQAEGMDKFSAIAHEYGHYFDAHISKDLLHFSEIDTINDTMAFGDRGLLNKVASSSDEFLSAVRKDREQLLSLIKEEKSSFISDLLKQRAGSAGVQDAIDGLFVNSRIAWGHGDKYYNRKYSTIKRFNRHKQLQKAYKDLGFDASNQAKTKLRCRQYEAASEMWANIMSAEVNGGTELEYVKKYLPNSYKKLKDILKEV